MMASGEAKMVGLTAREPSLKRIKFPTSDGPSPHERRSGYAAIDASQVEVEMQPTVWSNHVRGLPLAMQSEIEQLAARKKEVLMRGKETGRWREEIHQSIEREIDRRVRDALQTPPLERIRRNKHRAKLRQMQRERVQQEQRKHLSLLPAGGSTNANTLPSLHFPYPWSGITPSRCHEGQVAGNRGDARNGGDPIMFHHQPMSIGEGGQYHPPERFTGIAPKSAPTLQSLLEDTTDAAENGSSISHHHQEPSEELNQAVTDVKRKVFHHYTRAGFRAALKKGKLKLKKLGNGRFEDKNGIVLTADGPFWPPECGPLYPKQDHIPGLPREVEPLSTDVHESSRTVDNQKTKQFKPWDEGSQVVFDGERISKGAVPHATPERCCPSLAFESRFESGNLKQARRVGQFEYDLVLKTDLYTSRHTQWFYFRVEKMVPGVTYKFNIINLLKKDSLYNHGMRPLFYSGNLASSAGLGWHRTGHHISYCRNYNLSRNPLLRPEISYYTLSWQMEFPGENDTCYLTHCYPFTFTDLCQHLDTICADPKRKKYVSREVMCESRAGNSCFLVTVDNSEENAPIKDKKGVVVTARVHPGETNASWMMKGFLDFITSEDPVANKLRKTFTFKIIPMLNPDGVIVGNYRCSLSARDLNRTFRNPKRESFPTIWHTKAMLQEFGQETDVIAYCDLHGHSRKHNIFVYGCDQQGKETDAAAFLCQRLFPWLISKKAPDKFSFSGCRFQVRRCKESTGRVVMWRQMGIHNSFTMEATFCGSKNTQSCNRHFTTLDFEDMGRHFCEALLEYHRAQEDKSLHSEFILELTRVITQQVLVKQGLIPRNFDLFARTLSGQPLGTSVSADRSGVMNGVSAGDGDASTGKTEGRKPGKFEKARFNRPKEEAASKAIKKGPVDSHLHNKLEALHFFDSMDSETIQGCINLIQELQAVTDLNESDSDGSDSTAESDSPADKAETNDKKGRGKREKRKKNKKNGNEKKAVSAQGDITEEGKSRKSGKKSNHSTGKVVLKKYIPYVNRYQNRSNNGIPMFAEERTQERALKRISALEQFEQERLEREADKMFEEEDYMNMVSLRHRLPGQTNEVTYRLSSSQLGTQQQHLGTKSSPIGGDDTTEERQVETALYQSSQKLASRHVYTSDGQSTSDLDVAGTVAFPTPEDACDNFEVPPMFKSTDERDHRICQSDYHPNRWNNGGNVCFDPYQEAAVPSQPNGSDDEWQEMAADPQEMDQCRPAHRQERAANWQGRNAHSPTHQKTIQGKQRTTHRQERAQTSMAYSPSAGYLRRTTMGNVRSPRQAFTSRQSELMQRSSAPSKLKNGSINPIRLSLMHHGSPGGNWRSPAADGGPS